MIDLHSTIVNRLSLCVRAIAEPRARTWCAWLLLGALLYSTAACSAWMGAAAEPTETIPAVRTARSGGPVPPFPTAKPSASAPAPSAETDDRDVARVADLLQEPVTVSGDTVSGDTVSSDPVSTEAQALTVAERMAEQATAKAPDESALSPVVGAIDGALVNLRGGPGTHYGAVGQATAGEPLEIVGRNEDGSWWLVCCPAGEEAQSWVSAELVALSNEQTPIDLLTDSVPLAEIPPTPEAAPAPAAAAGNGGTSAASLAAAPASGLPGPGGFGAPGGTNPLTGLALPGGRNGQRPVIVCINNDFAARPQFGTANADVMYEYLMEGYGITRFSGVYYGEESAQIGPVRSARLINYYMGALYDAGLTCSGASDPVRYLLKHEAPFPYLDIDLDDPSNVRYSASIGTDYRTRLRTSTPQLHQWLADWGVEKPASIRGFTFGSTPGGGAAATSITVPYPSGSRSSYVYDAGSGRYLRSLGGGPHVDGNTGAQVAVENVIVQYVPHETTDIVEDSLGSLSIRLNLFGSGRALLFRDGQAFETTWRSDSQGDMPHFVGSDGAEVPLKPGKTWISIVPLSYGIEYR